jgi:uncharacterized protein YidB (DUF937 family)
MPTVRCRMVGTSKEVVTKKCFSCVPAVGAGVCYHWPVNKNRIDWSGIPLGKMPDAEIAKQLGVPSNTVLKARRRLGTPLFPQPKKEKVKTGRPIIDWDSAPLGLVSDSEVARQLGVPVDSVKKARKRRGVSRAEYANLAPNIDWDAVPLGERSDPEIAAELGISAFSVRKARKVRGIAAYKKPIGERPCGIVWPPIEDIIAELSTQTIKQVAAKLGVKHRTLYSHVSKRVGLVKALRGTLPKAKKTGKYPSPDELWAMLKSKTVGAVAEELGLARGTLYAHISRHMGSVKAHRGSLPRSAKEIKQPWPSRDWLKAEVELKGVEWVARHLGRAEEQVKRRLE